MRRDRPRAAAVASAAAVVSSSLLVLVAAPSAATANSGVQLRLDNYQAGTETTTPGPITNANFESAAGNVPAGWTPDSPVMTSGAPDPANLPNPPGVVGTRSAQAAQAGGISPFSDYFLTQTVTLQPNTDYVLSSYIWNYASAGPAPHNDFFAGDLAVVQLRDSDPNNFLNTAGMILEPIGRDNQTASRGYFVYKTFNSAQFSSATVGLEISFDPNQDLNFGVNRPAFSAQWDNVALTPLNQFAAQRYVATANGAWDSAANWVNGPADAVGAVATFNGNVATEAIVNLNGTRTVGVINRQGTGIYTLGGAGTLVLNHEEPNDAVIINNFGGGLAVVSPLVVGVGTMGNPAVLVTRNFRVNVAQAGDAVRLNSRVSAASVGTLGTGKYNLIKTGPGQLNLFGVSDVRSLRVDQGTVRMNPGIETFTSRVESIDIAGGATPSAKLDVTNQAFAIDYTGDSPLPTILAQIQSGFAGGNWSGNGIVTSSGSGYAVGYAEASELSSVPAVFGTTDATTLLLRGTRAGDANLDGTVNIADFSILAANFNLPGNWAKGDANYDGVTNIADFSLLASNFNLSAASAELPRGAAVPEPAALGALGVLTGAAAARRRRV